MTAWPEPAYSREAFEAILQLRLPIAAPSLLEQLLSYVVIRDDGVWLNSGAFDGPADPMDWSPACALRGEADPLTTPSLPFPFTSKQLAAFMLAGPGALVAMTYGPWESGPDEGVMRELSHRAGKGREVLRAAYLAVRMANPDGAEAGSATAVESIARALLCPAPRGIECSVTEVDRAYLAAWHDSVMNASTWWAISAVEPDHAAAVLTGRDPIQHPDLDAYFREASSAAAHARRLCIVFRGSASDGEGRSMEDWLSVALKHDLPIDTWVEEWRGSIGLTRKFDRATAESISRLTSFAEGIELRLDGLYVSESFRAHAFNSGADWIPALDMTWPGSPNPAVAPALPIPFSAADLAAFMLDGLGFGLQEAVGLRLGYALDSDALGKFESRSRWLQEAIQAAYEVAADAQARVGEYDHETYQREWGKSDGSIKAVKPLEDARITWRQAMVKELLGPKMPFTAADSESAPSIQRVREESGRSQPEGPTVDDASEPSEVPQVHSLETFERLQPTSQSFRGGRITNVDLLTLGEAAEMATRHAGISVAVSDILRSAARGEILLQAIVHHRAKVLRPGGGVCLNAGHATDQNTIPAGSVPTLPLVACRQLVVSRRASWRTIDLVRADDQGQFWRSLKYELEPQEPDFVSELDDCRVSGYDIHALADAFCAVGISAGGASHEEQTNHAGGPTHTNGMGPLDPQSLATPQQLIKAFGSFTGMDAAWFKNLTDVPSLLEARRVEGKGGRNSREPLFDPYAVMCWLVSERRKKGRPMSLETGWRRLKTFFPSAYERVEAIDPNHD